MLEICKTGARWMLEMGTGAVTHTIPALVINKITSFNLLKPPFNIKSAALYGTCIGGLAEPAYHVVRLCCFHPRRDAHNNADETCVGLTAIIVDIVASCAIMSTLGDSPLPIGDALALNLGALFTVCTGVGTYIGISNCEANIRRILSERFREDEGVELISSNEENSPLV